MSNDKQELEVKYKIDGSKTKSKSKINGPTKQHTIPMFMLYEWSLPSHRGKRRKNNDRNFKINTINLENLEIKQMKAENFYIENQYTISGADFSLEKGFAELEADIAELIKEINYTDVPGEIIKSEFYKENIWKLLNYYHVKSIASKGAKDVQNWYYDDEDYKEISERKNKSAKEMLGVDGTLFFKNRIEKAILLDNHTGYSFPAIQNIGVSFGMDFIIPVGPFRAIKFVMSKNTLQYKTITKYSRFVIKNAKKAKKIFDRLYMFSGGPIVVGWENKSYISTQGFVRRYVNAINRVKLSKDDVVPFKDTKVFKAVDQMVDEIDDFIDKECSFNVKSDKTI